MELSIQSHLKFKPPNFIGLPKTLQNLTHVELFSIKKLKNKSISRNPNARYFSGLVRACSDGGQREIFVAKKTSLASDVDTLRNGSSNSNDGHVAFFVRMLGLDNDPQDREQAVVSLWKYSLGGKQYVDNIMKYPGILNLIVNLLKSDSNSACEGAAGLLRVISSINMYRNLVAESGAIEEITGLLRRPSLSSDVRDQSLCTLWNLSVDEKLRERMISPEFLPLLVKFLEDEDLKVKEAAGGVLANLTLSKSNHNILVEAGAIPKLANLLKADVEESKIIRKEARNALLELAKDVYNKILIMEEGLVLVPLVGVEAYKSFKPSLYSWPSLPDGTKFEQSSKVPSKYGANELLLGLNIDNKNVDLEEIKMNAMVGRSQQQFLARIGAIELEDGDKSKSESSSSERLTILPLVDGVARLVLILGLADESAIARAAGAIADASINEHMRISFKEAGAIKNLVQLINHPTDTVRLAVIRALDKLSISYNVCQTIEAEGVLHPLINLLKQYNSEITHSLAGLILNILTRILDPNRVMKSKFNDGLVKENETTSSELTSSIQTIDKDLFDSNFISYLVNILKTPIPDLQRKAASVLEFIIVIESSAEKIISSEIESGLEAVFQQKSLQANVNDVENEEPERHILELEEAGLATSAASRLLTRLLDYSPFHQNANTHNFKKLLRNILISNLPLQYKDWVASCLIKLTSISTHSPESEKNPINIEVTLYETIPRLIEKIETSFSSQAQEAAVLELNQIISEGFLDTTRAVASKGGIFPLVKLMETGSDRAVEASLVILYNLSMDLENHSAILAAGAVPILKKIVLVEKPYWARALRLLRNLPT